MKGYIYIKDVAFPNPHDPNDIEWKCRYGRPTRNELIKAANFIGAYKRLVLCDTLARSNKKISLIRYQLKENKDYHF